jgi:hypothetical protein
MPLAPQWRALGKGHAAEWERSETDSPEQRLAATRVENRMLELLARRAT